MVNEGEFPKSDGDILYASEVNIFAKDNNYTLANAYRSALSPSPRALRLNTDMNYFASDSLASTSNMTHKPITTYGEYFATSGTYSGETYGTPFSNTITTGKIHMDYEIYTIYDEFTDGSVNHSLWTSGGTVSESSNTLNIAASSSIYSNDLSGSNSINVTGKLVADGADGATVYTYLQLSDGTNHVNILNAAQEEAAEVETVYYDMNFHIVDWGSKLVHGVGKYYVNDPLNRLNEYSPFELTYTYDQLIDCSSLSDLRIRVVTGANSSSATIYNLRIANNNPSTTATVTISPDNGANFETTLNGAPHKFTNSGSQIRSKIAGTVQDGEVLVLKGVTHTNLD